MIAGKKKKKKKGLGNKIVKLQISILGKSTGRNDICIALYYFHSHGHDTHQNNTQNVSHGHSAFFRPPCGLFFCPLVFQLVELVRF